MMRGPVNPFVVFEPTVVQTIDDTESLVLNVIDDPFPITQAALGNATENLFTLLVGEQFASYDPNLTGDFGTLLGGPGVVNAALVLSAAGFDVPFAIVEAVQLSLKGEYQEALQALAEVTVIPAKGAANDVITAVQEVINNEITVARGLVTAVPDAAKGIVDATINSVLEITKTAVTAGVGVLKAGATLNPVQV
ncbi:MAG TPA: hypothetical protein VMU34_04080 [Mycobacterium sp.]|nr:hypothetical protein [Mycobacterium sp.]